MNKHWKRFRDDLRDIPATLSERQKMIFRKGAFAVYRAAIEEQYTRLPPLSPEELKYRKSLLLGVGAVRNDTLIELAYRFTTPDELRRELARTRAKRAKKSKR